MLNKSMCMKIRRTSGVKHKGIDVGADRISSTNSENEKNATVARIGRPPWKPADCCDKADIKARRCQSLLFSLWTWEMGLRGVIRTSYARDLSDLATSVSMVPTDKHRAGSRAPCSDRPLSSRSCGNFDKITATSIFGEKRFSPVYTVTSSFGCEYSWTKAVDNHL